MRSTIFIYIAKNFIIKFITVVIAISTLILIINLFDGLDLKSDAKVSWITILKMIPLQIPAFLEDISIFLIMLSAILCLSSLSTKSEITIMRSSGLSLWQILSPSILTSFILGILFVFLFNPLTIACSKKFNAMKQNLNGKESSNILAPSNGIWLKQQNILQKGEEIVIRAKSIDKDNFELSDINLWFFDNDGKLYQKIDANTMLL